MRAESLQMLGDSGHTFVARLRAADRAHSRGSAAARLAAHPEIERLEHNVTYRACVFSAPSPASSQRVDWGIQRVGASLSSTKSGDGQGTAGGNVHVFVLDTGVTHPDVAVVEDRFFLGGSASDENGHGTFCAGVIGALDNSSYTVGVCPGVPVHNFRVLDENGAGTLASLVAAMQAVLAWRAANPGTPCVVSMSLGVPAPAWNMLDGLVQSAINDSGIVVCVAAGNDGVDCAGNSPAHVPEAITVGAYDSSDRLAPWSNWGPDVDLLAPGANILALWPTSGPAASADGGDPAAGVHTLSGTSMATPCVAGVAALYLSRFPRATPAQVKSALIDAAARARDSGQNPPIDLQGRAGTTALGVWAGAF